MNKIETLKKQREEIDKKIKEEESKTLYIEVPELGIKIIPKQMFNNKIYSKILNEVDESQIATYDILQKLRNISFKSNWKKYPFMKSFWVVVPNPDEYEKSKGSVAGFYASDGGSGLGCDRVPSDGDSGLGVFLYCPITDKAQKSKEKKK
jgi:hypothetical protein